MFYKALLVQKNPLVFWRIEIIIDLFQNSGRSKVA